MAEQINLHRLKNLSGQTSEPDDVESASDDSIGYEENPRLEAFLAGKAVRSEISLRELSTEDRARFDASMAKEWAFNAVEVLSEDKLLSSLLTLM